jgi:hypothetical protein
MAFFVIFKQFCLVISERLGSGRRLERLRNPSFLEFPLPTSATNEQGALAFQTLELDNPVNIGRADL